MAALKCDGYRLDFCWRSKPARASGMFRRPKPNLKCGSPLSTAARASWTGIKLLSLRSAGPAVRMVGRTSIAAAKAEKGKALQDGGFS